MVGEVNWAGNVTYRASRIHRPATVEEVEEIVRAAERVRAVGTRHSFSELANTDAELAGIDRLNRVVGIDAAAKIVTVEGGIRFGELGAYLHRSGFALANMASLPHISVAGAVATATHGSGERNGCLSTMVEALDLVGPEGVARWIQRGESEFDAAVVGLGALGVVTQLKLRIEPTFSVRQYVFEGLPLADVWQHFDEIEAAGYSVSLFTDWRTDRINQVWVKRKVAAGDDGSSPAELFGARQVGVDRHPIGEISAENCTPQVGVPGPWHERLPHFRLEFTPSSGEELQAEYFVPRERAVEALQVINAMRGEIAPVLLISEIRTVAKDSLWLSMAYGRDSVAIHFTLKPDRGGVERLLPKVEAALKPFDARPHWGKLFTLDAARLREVYPRMGDFQRVMRTLDPAGKFANAFITGLLRDF